MTVKQYWVKVAMVNCWGGHVRFNTGPLSLTGYNNYSSFLIMCLRQVPKTTRPFSLSQEPR